ncbi:hypothetical protein DFP72DRAFT_1021891 [Ephemerocybe angulata]|uniref:Uncharacterized protein n=1 Tax=Ephemerocybe angulata TaxID=980116 RepID=A0A8H6LUK6_9AGAR|nr:hypothetical protein DFP72DRAFT_1021891 [Tulosesus angulatus]
MSLFRPDLWAPVSVDYPVQLLRRPFFLADYITALVIATVFVGVQLTACGYILRHYYNTAQRRRKSNMDERLNARYTVSRTWCLLSVYLATIYTASAAVYCISFAQRYISVTKLGMYEKGEKSLEWLRQNPEHDGVKMICIPATSAPGGEEICHLFKYTKNLLQHQGLEVAYSSLIEALIVPVDFILIFRFSMMYYPSKWKYLAVGILSALSLTGPIIGIVALGKIASLGVNSDPWWPANFQGVTGFLEWQSPWVAVVMPVIVNVFVTAAIIVRIRQSQRYIRKVGGRMLYDEVYTGLLATLVESAFPSALWGVLAAAFPRVASSKAENFVFTPMVLWVALTALSPQFIIIRVMQGRALTRGNMAGLNSTAPGDPLAFADTAGSSTVLSTAVGNSSGQDRSPTSLA